MDCPFNIHLSAYQILIMNDGKQPGIIVEKN